MQGTSGDKSPSRTKLYSRLNTISSYNSDEQKWSNYVPIRKSASTSKNNLSQRATYGNDIESEFKKAIDSIKKQNIEKKRESISQPVLNKSPTVPSKAVSKLRQSNNDKLNESLDKNVIKKHSIVNGHGTERSSRSSNYAGSTAGSQAAFNRSMDGDLDSSMNKSITSHESTLTTPVRKENKKNSAILRDSSNSKERSLRISSISPMSKTKSITQPSPTNSIKSTQSFGKFVSSSGQKDTKLKSPASPIPKTSSLSNLKTSSLPKTDSKSDIKKETPKKSYQNHTREQSRANLEQRLEKYEQDLQRNRQKLNSLNEKVKEQGLLESDKKKSFNTRIYTKLKIEKFNRKLDSVIKHVSLFEKRNFFISLLTILHEYKLKVTKLLIGQDIKMEGRVFKAWLAVVQQSRSNPEANKENDYQIISPRATNSTSKIDSVEKRNILTGRSRPSKDLGGASNQFSLNNSKELINATFERSSVKNNDHSFSPNKTPNTDRYNHSPETFHNSNIDHSFGCDNGLKSVEKRPQGLESILADLSPSRMAIDKDESIPDQILTEIPQPIKKEIEPIPHEPEPITRIPKPRTSKTPVSSHSRVLEVSKSQQLPSKKLQQLEEKVKQRRENISLMKKKHEEPKPQRNSVKSPEKRETSKTPTSTIRNKTLRSNTSSAQKEEVKVPIVTKKVQDEIKKEDAKEREMKLYMISLNKALNFHKKNVLVKTHFGFTPLKKILELSRLNKQRALEYRQESLLRKAYQAIACYKNTEDESEDEDDEERLFEADLHYKSMLKMNTFNAFLKNFVQSFEEEGAYVKYREDHLKRVCFSKWFLMLPTLKSEKEDLEEAYDNIITKFRFIILCESSLRKWRKHVDDEKKLRIKSEKESGTKRSTTPLVSNKSANLSKPSKI